MTEPVNKQLSSREWSLSIFWGLVATISVCRGLFLAVQPDQSKDLRVIYGWISQWLLHASSPYQPQAGLWAANYAPHGIVFLSPLALLSETSVVWLWAVLNLTLAVGVALVTLKLFKTDRNFNWLLPSLLFLSWAGLRIGLGNGQSTLLMMFFGLLAVLYASERPYLSGFLLALSLIKPHIGIVFLLWMFLNTRFKPVVVASMTMVCGLVFFGLRVGQTPLDVTKSAFAVLNAQFGGTRFLIGTFELRPFIHAVVPGFGVAEVLNIVVVSTLLILIGWLALAPRYRGYEHRGQVLLQLVTLWTLLAFFQNPYNSVLLLPVLIGLWYSGDANVFSFGKYSRMLLWTLQLALVIEFPSLIWKLRPYLDLAMNYWVRMTFSNIDRILVLALFVIVAYRFLRQAAVKNAALQPNYRQQIGELKTA